LENWNICTVLFLLIILSHYRFASILPPPREALGMDSSPARAAQNRRFCALYARVSTADQTCENQLRELRALAERNGWRIIRELVDHGVSGAKGRDQRPALDQLLKLVARREVDVVMAWSVDRLGRSLTHLVEVLAELHAKGIDLVIAQNGVDTTTPGGRAMFQMLGVFAEFERSLIRERVAAGLARARANGTKLGRPSSINDSVRTAVGALRDGGRSVRHIARELRIGVGSVQRILGAD